MPLIMRRELAIDRSRPIEFLCMQPMKRGSVQSVFLRAANIVCGETLLALLSEELPRMPNGVRLAKSHAEMLLRQLQPGMEVLVGDGLLVFLDCRWRIAFCDVPVWEPRPAVECYHWVREVVVQHTDQLARILAREGSLDGLAPLSRPLFQGQGVPATALAQMAFPGLYELAQASWQDNREGVEGAVRTLAGLGPGLTPAGDDVLAGFIAVMVLLSPYLSVDGRERQHLGGIIASVAVPRTTILSAVLFNHAARGEVAEQLGDLLLALASDVVGDEGIDRCANRLLAFGASSGSDTLLGIVLGLRTLEGWFGQ